MNQYLSTRSRFLRNAAVTSAGAVVVSGLGSTIFAQVVSGVSIIVDPVDTIANSAPAQWAINLLKQALEGQNKKVQTFQGISQAPAGNIAIVASSANASLTLMIGVDVPKSP